MSRYGWRKASYSNSQGACVETASWRRANACDGGTCLEAGHGAGIVGVRDTKNKGLGPVLKFSSGVWSQFLAGLK